VTKSKMEEIFRIAGNVIEIDLKTDKDGRSRGMCTVRYEHPMEAVQAIGILCTDCAVLLFGVMALIASIKLSFIKPS